MILIENAYYSSNTKKISIVLKQTSQDAIGTILSSLDYVRINKYMSGEKKVFYVNSSNAIENSEMAIVTIDPVSDVTGDIEFSIDGISELEISVNSARYSKPIYNNGEFYSYKIHLYSLNSNPKNISILNRFLFAEKALCDSITLGFVEDAYKFYSEMKKLYNIYKSIE